MSVLRFLTPKPTLVILSLVCLAVALPACERARQSLGLGKNPPDEFKIVARAPLAVPTEFTLPPPSPGMNRPQELQPEEDAQVALFGTSITGNDQQEFTAGEESILTSAAISDDVDDIRTTIDQEHAEMQVEEDWVDDVVFWREVPDPTEVLIDPDKETNRLQSNSALGLPANEGDFEGVVVETRDKAIFEDIF